MKVITEAILRSELRASTPECYKVPEGKILSPAAREYLQQCKIRIDDGKSRPGPRKQEEASREEPGGEQQAKVVATEVPPMPEVQVTPRYSAMEFMELRTRQAPVPQESSISPTRPIREPLTVRLAWVIGSSSVWPV